MISTNYTDLLGKTEIKTTDYLRIIADLVSANNDVSNRVKKASKLANIFQKRLGIPAQHEVAVGILSILFCHSTIYGKVPFRRLKLKMYLLDLTNPLVVEDFIYLLNEKFITLEKSVQNIEYISSTDELYKKLWGDMRDENRNLFMLLAGKQLNKAQLKYFKSKLFNEGLDISELFRTAVVLSQFNAAKLLIDFGYDQNKDELTPWEVFLCSYYNGSKFALDFYISVGLKITQKLIDEVLVIAEEQIEYFDYEDAEELVKELKLKMVAE